MKRIVPRRVLLSVSDKNGLVPLARELVMAGAELVATGNTAQILLDAGLSVTPIERVTGNPEVFGGRMKTLSFQICSGILFRRGHADDEKDAKRLQIAPIDCVVVNFYPFEKTLREMGSGAREALVEKIDIGGPTLVRAAAKNSPDVCVLTDPAQYAQAIEELRAGGFSAAFCEKAAAMAWDLVRSYDAAIAREFGGSGRTVLRYGENPHQKATLEEDPQSPIAWRSVTDQELSYNNILDISSAYSLCSEILDVELEGANDIACVVIVKHNNPCGAARVPFGSGPDERDAAQLRALQLAWEGDPTSAFGGVVMFSSQLGVPAARWLSERFIEAVAAPELNAESPALKLLHAKRKKLKAVCVRVFGVWPERVEVRIPGGLLVQTPDRCTESSDVFSRAVTRSQWPASMVGLARFGVAVTAALKSNAVALVRECSALEYQLVGAGQGQPNRVDAIEKLALPRARAVCGEQPGALRDCVMISDAFFPFRDSVDVAARAGVRYIVQPGGSLKDAESIAACDEHGISMLFTRMRHFRH